MIIIGINNFELDLFLVDSIIFSTNGTVHIDTHLVTAEVKKFKLMCENFEIQ